MCNMTQKKRNQRFDTDVVSDTKLLLRKHNLKAKKALGQNFLIDSNIVSDIVDCAEVCEEDGVIEIGPGLGVMTAALSERAAQVTAVEIDRNMLEPLQEVLAGKENVTILHEDFLKADVDDIIRDLRGNPQVKRIKVIANLPYYITTPIIMKLLEREAEMLLSIDTMVFMMQKEVAERMCATPGGKEYGALTLSVQYLTEAKIKMIVKAESFLPVPAVDSAVIRMDVRQEAPVETEHPKLMFQVIKAAFSQRRKTLMNALGNSGIVNGGKAALGEILTNMNLDLNIRGEALSLEEYAKLTDDISRRG